MSKQLIGILLASNVWKFAKRGWGYEKLDLYLKAAKKYDIDICFFCFHDINIKEGTVKAKFKINNQWERKNISLPKVIHNRVKFRSSSTKESIQELEEKYGVIFYNTWNNFSKFEIHNIIAKALFKTFIT